MQYVVVFLTEIDFNLLAYDISGPQYYFFNSTEIIHVLNINSILLFLSLWTLCVAIQIQCVPGESIFSQKYAFI